MKRFRFKRITSLFIASVLLVGTSAVAVSCVPSLPDPLSAERYVYDKTNDYYKELDGLRGSRLAEALRNLQIKHSRRQRHSYSDLLSFMKKNFIDKYFDNDDTIIDIYSERNGRDPYNYKPSQNIYSAKKEGEGWNREHIIPQSWFNYNDTPKSDIHFVYPSDAYVNGQRSNGYHDEVVSAVTKTFKNGAKIGRNEDNDVVFEPNDIMKGDIARAYFYFLFTYIQNHRVDINYQISVFSEKPDKKFDEYIRPKFLKTYLKWNKFDPIDIFNIELNNKIANFNNGLRNPFVDYPELPELLFSDNPEPFVNKGVLVSVKDA